MPERPPVTQWLLPRTGGLHSVPPAGVAPGQGHPVTRKGTRGTARTTTTHPQTAYSPHRARHPHEPPDLPEPPERPEPRAFREPPKAPRDRSPRPALNPGKPPPQGAPVSRRPSTAPRPRRPRPPAGTPTAQDTVSDVVRWAAFSCVLVPVVLVGYGTSLAGAAGTAVGLAAVTGACRVLLRRSERGAARLRTEERPPCHEPGHDPGHEGHHGSRHERRGGAGHERRGRAGAGDSRRGRHAGGNTPVD